MDLASEHERYIAEKLFKMPTCITNYPKKIKSFYMKLNDDKQTVQSFDMLVPGIGELIGGSVREENLDKLIDNMKEKNLKVEDYQR